MVKFLKEKIILFLLKNNEKIPFIYGKTHKDR